LGSYIKVEAIQASKKNARNLAAQFLYDELSLRYQKYTGKFMNFKIRKSLFFPSIFQFRI